MNRLLPILILIFSSSFSAFAGHNMGYTIEYTAIDTYKFELHVYMYRDCRGVGLSNPSSNFQVRCLTSGTTRGVSLSLQSIEEITPFDKTTTGGCVPSNTYGTGEGVEKHSYIDTIDFNDSLYLPLKSCCDILFEATVCCRNSAINTGAGNQNNYNYAYLNLCLSNNNSSPTYSYEPLAIQCCNQPVYANLGYKDTNDFDSISYSLTCPLKAYNQAVPYSGTGYSCSTPFKVYYPGSLTPPYNNPNANPPVGLYLDANTGDMIYTPIRCDEVTVAGIEIKEWRKDTSGTYQVVGIVRSDLQYITKSCPDNNPPEIDGPYSYSVCAGATLCFNITTDDDVFVPPPPASSPPPDTVTLEWNEGIPDATFNILSTSALHQAGRFCWTPKDEDARDLPYQFTVQARDNATPLNSISRRSVRVKVKPRAKAITQITKKTCGYYEVESQPESNFTGTPSYRWEILDSNSNPVFDDNIAKFVSTGGFISVSQEDSVRFNAEGLFIIRHTINNSPQNCPTYVNDTIRVDDHFQVNFNYNDTTLCFGEQLTLIATLKNAQSPIQYNWDHNQQPSSDDTTNSIQTDMQSGGTEYIYSLTVNDANGCEATQKLFISTYDEFEGVLDDTVYHCFDTLSLNVGSAFTDILWSTSETDSLIEVMSTGNYSVQLTDLDGCEHIDSTYVVLLDDPISELRDTALCDNKVTLDAGNFVSFDWSTGDTTRSIVYRKNGLVFLTIEDKYGCFGTDSIEVTLYDDPVITLQDNIEFCCNDGAFDLNTLLSSDDSTGGNWFNSAYPLSVANDSFYPAVLCKPTNTNTFISYSYTNPQTGCTGSDSVLATVKPLPYIVLDSMGYCKAIGSADLGKDLVKIPANPFFGIFSWECIDCNGNDFAKMIADKGTVNFPAYFLYFNDTSYTMQNDEIDTIVLKYNYTNALQCANSEQTEVYIYAEPKTPVLTRVDDTLFSSISGVSWYKDGALLGDRNSDTLVMNIPGDYKAKQISPYGCGESSFSFVHTRLASVEEFKELGLKLYPNPTNGAISIEYEPNALEIVEVRLFNAEGKTIEIISTEVDGEININFVAPVGFYTLEVTTNKGVAQEKIVMYGQW